MEIRNKEIGEGEKQFFRELVEENGLYEKDEKLSIDKEHVTYADYSVRGRKTGTVADVSIRVRGAQCTPLHENTPLYEIEGKSIPYVVSVSVIKDTGLLHEVINESIKYMAQRMRVRENEEAFKEKRIIKEEMYHATHTSHTQHTHHIIPHTSHAQHIDATSTMYGIVATQRSTHSATESAVGNAAGVSFFVSPVHQEVHASDSLLFISSQKEGTDTLIKEIRIHRGIDPEALKKILSYHTMRAR
ncbi:hypothetical protein NEFER03_2073 [Nematocida sp. LUAm3]|nr:hypothetical protein NEFER03_2073 [Nematocida sp. LUAm3]KAI5176209.1 hypothetical protein NEFER02_2015 [Nematocida sp. LUAm2]KAI5179197.1 hypothetical protein NEFER01_2054 [Nematocida sp. LUAm1]